MNVGHAGLIGLPDPLEGQLEFALNENSGFASPLESHGLPQANIVLDPTWSTWHFDVLCGFFSPPGTPGPIELDWHWNASEVGSGFTEAGEDDGLKTITQGEQVLGELVRVRLAEDIPVIPGAFVTATVARSGLAGDVAVYGSGHFALFAVVFQRAS